MTDQTVALPGAVALEPPSTVLNPETVSTTSGGGKTDISTQNDASIQSVLEAELKTLKENDAKAEAEARSKAEDAAKEARTKVEDAAKKEAKPEKTDNRPAEKAPEKGEPEQAAAERGAPEENRQSEGRKFSEPPARFVPEARGEWDKVPEAVRAEVHRAIKNLEDGHQKYREAADRYEQVREFDEIARRNGRQGVHESLRQIVDIENTIARNPVEGFQKIANHYGLDLNKIAHHIASIDPDQRLSALQQENQQLRAQIDQSQRAAQMPSFIDQYRQTEGHERFDELAEDIAFFLKTVAKDGPADQRLDAAYQLAVRMKPVASSAAPDPKPAASPAATASPAPERPDTAGTKSVRGAPSDGADTPADETETSLEELIRKEMRKLKA